MGSCQLTHPVMQLFCGRNRSARRKPKTFGRALTCTLFSRGLNSSHIEEALLRFKYPATLEEKGKWSYHLATELTICGLGAVHIMKFKLHTKVSHIVNFIYENFNCKYYFTILYAHTIIKMISHM